MTPSQAGEVLTYASAIDNRIVTPEASLLWSQILRSDITVEEAQRAVASHFGNSTEYLKPAHVNEIVASERRSRSRDLPPVTPPRDLADDPRRELEWKRIWGDAVIAGHTETAARNIANLQLGVSDDLLLAIGSAEVEKQLDSFRDAFLTPKPRPTRPPIVRLPARWAADRGLQILDPDGWRDAGKDFRAPCTEAEFDELLPTCTVGPFERVIEPADMPPVGAGGTTPRDPAIVAADTTNKEART